MSVTKESIKAQVDAYYTWARTPDTPNLQLIRGVVVAVTSVGGEWEPDDEKLFNSTFAGLTILCWLFSATKPADAAEAYEYLVLRSYNIWAQLLTGTKKTAFQTDCHNYTDTLPQWTSITRVTASRTAIIYQAISVTSSMYGDSAQQTQQSTTLWNGRL